MKNRRHKNKTLPIILLLIAISLLTIIFLSLLFDTRISSDRPISQNNQETKQPHEIYSESMLLMSLDKQETIAHKNADLKTYPASLTKIMTTLILCENHDIRNQYFTMSYDIYEENELESASTAGIHIGDELLGIDLLYGTMLPSGADAALMLVYGLDYSQEEFAQLMNDKAYELGLENTHFTNPTGLHNEQQYTTAKDMATLLTYALKNETFRSIYTASNYTTQPTKLNPDGYHFRSTTFATLQNKQFVWGDIIGGKTGYTEEAGLNLSTLAQDNKKKEYILITLGAPGSQYTEPFHFLDAYNLYDQYLSK